VFYCFQMWVVSILSIIHSTDGSETILRRICTEVNSSAITMAGTVSLIRTHNVVL
jgi:hypothetical protein